MFRLVVKDLRSYELLSFDQGIHDPLSGELTDHEVDKRAFQIPGASGVKYGKLTFADKTSWRGRCCRG